MKKIILAVLLFPVFIFAEVTVHENRFSITDSTGGNHFYGRFYTWSSWSKSPTASSFEISPNVIKQAFDDGEGEFAVGDEGLSEKEIMAVFPKKPEEGEALLDYYDSYGEVGVKALDYISNPREIVFNTKVSVPLPASFNISELTLKTFVGRAIKADSPHLYAKVSKNFVHNLINPIHKGHKQLLNHNNDEIYLGLFNFGYEYYQCSSLNRLLNASDANIGGALFSFPYRIYTINMFREITLAEAHQIPIIEGSPKKVFEQKIVESSKLIKSGMSYVAFYEPPGGVKRVVIYSAIVSSSKIKNRLGDFVNGEGSIKGSDIVWDAKGEVVLSSKSLDLAPVYGACSKGLAAGVGRYVYRLAKRIAED